MIDIIISIILVILLIGGFCFIFIYKFLKNKNKRKKEINLDNIDNDFEYEYEIEMDNISKTFGDIKANDDITIKLKKGEVLALLGENGAGKSTLMSILFGLYQPDNGVIKRKGKEVKINGPLDANKLGIGMVHQHFRLVDVFTVLENIILGVEPTKYNFVLSKKEARKKVLDLANKYEFNVDLDAKIENISVGMQQKVEILKMLYRDNDVLIFDEPTAVLTPQEIDELLKIIKNFANEGKSIIFISHKLDEILNVADRCAILRNGKLIKTLNVKDTNKEELSKLMVGREVSFDVIKSQNNPQNKILKVRNLVMENRIHKKLNSVNNVSFDVYDNEIVGICGIDGNGQSELVYGITGLEKIKSGEVFLFENNITKKSIFKRNKMGISHIPEDRQKDGLVLDFPLDYNMVLETHYFKEFTKGIFINNKNIRLYSDNLIKKYDIRSSLGSASITRSMSGGNQQKAIVYREVERNKDLLIAFQPTRGLDVGSIENVHNAILTQRDKGKAILLVSFELDEILKLSDRILVMFKGEIVGELDPKKTTREELGLYMAGVKKDYEFKERA